VQSYFMLDIAVFLEKTSARLNRNCVDFLKVFLALGLKLSDLLGPTRFMPNYYALFYVNCDCHRKYDKQNQSDTLR
jgi:hypothetical protein